MSQGPRRAIWPDDRSPGAAVPAHQPRRSSPASEQPTWAPPAADQTPAGVPGPAGPRRRLPTAAKVLLAAVLALVVVIAGLWAAGGFQTRQTLVDKQAGEPLDLGPVELTVQQAISYDFAGEAQIEVPASCRLTTEQSAGTVHYAIARNSFAGVRVNGEVQLSPEVMMTLGVDDGLYFGQTRQILSPGVPAVACVLRFTLPLAALDADTVTVLLWRLQFTEQGNVKNDQDTSKTWNASSDGYRVQLPLTQVAR